MQNLLANHQSLMIDLFTQEPAKIKGHFYMQLSSTKSAL